MSQDAQLTRYHRRRLLLCFALTTTAIGAAAIRGASPTLTDPAPTPLLTITQPSTAAKVAAVTEYRLSYREPVAPVPLTIRPRPKGWAEFEAEYGIAKPHSSPFIGGLQLAKYTIDEVTFGADQFLKSLSKALEFEYRGGGWKYGASTGEPVPGRRHRAFDNTKLKFDVAFQDGGPYLGVRMIVPLGR